eukprot:UN08102
MRPKKTASEDFIKDTFSASCVHFRLFKFATKSQSSFSNLKKLNRNLLELFSL